MSSTSPIKDSNNNVNSYFRDFWFDNELTPIPRRTLGPTDKSALYSAGQSLGNTMVSIMRKIQDVMKNTSLGREKNKTTH